MVKYFDGASQKLACKGRRATIAVIQNIIGYFWYDELINGSNDEKISIIIKIWGIPLGALKASSFFNLKS